MFYLYIVLYVFFIGWLLIKRDIGAPLGIYVVWFSLYPLITILYFNVITSYIDISYVDSFDPWLIQQFTSCSVFALLGLLVSYMVSRKYWKVESYTLAVDYPRILSVFLLSGLFTFFGLYLLVLLKYKNIFFDNYVYQYIRVENFDPAVLKAVSMVTSVEIIFIIFFQSLMVFYMNRPHNKKLFIAMILLYAAVKFMVGSRLLLVVVFVSYYVTFLHKRVKIRFLYQILFVFCFIGFFMLFNLKRHGFESSALSGLMDLGLEFTYSSLSAINSIDFVASGNGLNILKLLNDFVFGLVPSVLLGGNKSDYINFVSWVDDIGGFKNISPVGGYYLVGQVYLYSHSVLFILLFFIVYGSMIAICYRNIFSKTNLWVRLISLQAVSFGLVFGIRTELWVLSKMWIQQFILIPVVLGILYTGMKFLLRVQR